MCRTLITSVLGKMRKIVNDLNAHIAAICCRTRKSVKIDRLDKPR